MAYPKSLWWFKIKMGMAGLVFELHAPNFQKCIFFENVQLMLLQGFNFEKRKMQMSSSPFYSSPCPYSKCVASFFEY